MSTPLLSIRNGSVTFGGKPLLQDITLHIMSGDRICLVGRNGEGKSTLMHAIAGIRELDGGERWTLTGLKIGFLPQQVTYLPGERVKEYILAGLPKEEQTEDKHYLADMVMTPMELNADDLLNELSGGQQRRAALARALVAEPDILLLDEPTNHLDLAAIEWLEKFLKFYRNAVVCISHDRTFLSTISRQTFWIDRGKLRISPRGYSHFEQWSLEALEQEQRELVNLSKKVALEDDWLHGGISARRKRNERRLRELHAMRAKLKADRAALNQVMNKIKLDPLASGLASKLIAEFDNVSKNFGGKAILSHFSFRAMKGDRIGILGKNGSGKSTFLKLMLGELAPDEGRIKRGKTLQISYFDQKRTDLDPEKTLWETLCPGGGDTVTVAGKPQHVVGYLKRFMFDPKSAKSPVSTLSGGQANRLLLAKILANPGSVLILDEPTNDLDMDTLDMLQEILSDYPGTLIVVSHDRDFLDRVVTKVLAFEGDGIVEGYIGGYSDYIAEKRQKLGLPPIDAKKEKPLVVVEKPATPVKMSYKLQREWELLPEKVSELEEEIRDLEEILSDSGLYVGDPERFSYASRRLEKAKREISQAETRWLELEEMRSGIK